MKSRKSQVVEIQELMLHCPLCQGNMKAKTYLCPHCKRIMLYSEHEDNFNQLNFCGGCGHKLTE
jgi:C4-type Zn-finger protein